MQNSKIQFYTYCVFGIETTVSVSTVVSAHSALTEIIAKLHYWIQLQYKEAHLECTYPLSKYSHYQMCNIFYFNLLRREHYISGQWTMENNEPNIV